jgi:hypothetical protein
VRCQRCAGDRPHPVARSCRPHRRVADADDEARLDVPQLVDRAEPGDAQRLEQPGIGSLVGEEPEDLGGGRVVTGDVEDLTAVPAGAQDHQAATRRTCCSTHEGARYRVAATRTVTRLSAA